MIDTHPDHAPWPCTYPVRALFRFVRISGPCQLPVLMTRTIARAGRWTAMVESETFRSDPQLWAGDRALTGAATHRDRGIVREQLRIFSAGVGCGAATRLQLNIGSEWIAVRPEVDDALDEQCRSDVKNRRERG